MFSGMIEDFVAGLRGGRSFDPSTLAFEAIPTDALAEVYGDLRVLRTKLDAAATAVAGLLADRRPDPFPAPPDATTPDGADAAPPPPPVVPYDKEARNAARLARDLADLPATKAAFDAGRLTADQARAVARLAADPMLGDALRADEADLVDQLVTAGLDDSGTILRDWKERVSATRARRDAEARYRKRSLRTWTDAEGMTRVHITGADEAGAAVKGFLQTLLDAYWRTTRAGSGSSDGPIDERTREQRDFDGLTWALERAVAGLSAGAIQPRPRTTMVVNVDYLDFLAGHGGIDLTTDTPLCGEDIRRLACDAGIARLVTKGDSIPLDRGRETRLATPAQRQTLATIYRTCARPGCAMPFAWCDIHHIDEYVADLGETNIDDLVPLCDHDHHQTHHGGHHIERGVGPGAKQWVTPDDVTYPIRPDPPGSRARVRRRRPPPGEPHDADLPPVDAEQLALGA